MKAGGFGRLPNPVPRRLVQSMGIKDVFKTRIMAENKRSASILYSFWFLILLVASVLGSPGHAMVESDEVWLLVDTNHLTLAVMRGESVMQKYNNIAIGSNGPTEAKLVSDETTPLGEFKISDINPRSRYHLFLLLDYPTMDHAQRALADGRIAPEEFVAVSNAWLEGELPPQNTQLGGFLGIHGIGDGSLEIHRNVNWTDGCIAMTNEEMDELADLVGVGTRVSVR
jgi:murein L,D-transpeptidase YafK